jgi:putative ABC transport system ATP-binding protein
VRLALDVCGDCSRRARSKAEDALATVGLSHKSKSFPKELSGGEQQRVAIARAIVGEPSLILADEPTAALDSENGHAVMTLLADIAKDAKRTLFIVTHDPRIMPFADRILRIEDGQIVGDQKRGERNSTVRALKIAS